ncbi:MAG: hypothetical protein ACRCX2_14665 [Paraclostridium sp.]
MKLKNERNYDVNFLGCSEEQKGVLKTLCDTLSTVTRETMVESEDEYEMEWKVEDAFLILKQLILGEFECTHFYEQPATGLNINNRSEIFWSITPKLYQLKPQLFTLLKSPFTLSKIDIELIKELLESVYNKGIARYLWNEYNNAYNHKMIPECIEPSLLSIYSIINKIDGVHLTYSCSGHMVPKLDGKYIATELYFVLNIDNESITEDILTIRKELLNYVKSNLDYMGNMTLSNGKKLKDTIFVSLDKISDNLNRLTFRVTYINIDTGMDELAVHFPAPSDFIIPDISDYSLINSYQVLLANEFAKSFTVKLSKRNA